MIFLSIYTKESRTDQSRWSFQRGSTVRISAGRKGCNGRQGRELLNMCANNYLGLGDNQRLIDAAKRT